MQYFPFLPNSTALSIQRFFPGLDVVNFNMLYPMNFLEAIDGDTIRIDLHIFPDVTLKGQRVRLARINTPEPKSIGALQNTLAKSALDKILTGSSCFVQPCRRVRDKYQRLLCEIFVPVQCALSDYPVSGIPIFFNLSDYMLSCGMAVKYA